MAVGGYLTHNLDDPAPNGVALIEYDCTAELAVTSDTLFQELSSAFNHDPRFQPPQDY